MAGSDQWNNIACDFFYFKDREEFTSVGLNANDYLRNTYVKERKNRAGQIVQQEQGKPPFRTDGINDYRDVVEYYDPDGLERNIAKFEDWISKINMGGAFNKHKLKITSDERGIFSFSLASRGLYKPIEFYSEELAKELPLEFESRGYASGIVPALFVNMVEIFGEPIYTYTSQNNNKEYVLKKQQEGTREIELQVPNAKLRYKTKEKKSYIILPKKGGKAKMIDLYIPKNQGVQLLNILPTLMVAYFMRLYGVMCRISVVRTFNYTSRINGLRRSGYTGYGFKIKDFGDDLDFNKIALEAVDDRTWQIIMNCVGNFRLARQLDPIRFPIGTTSEESESAGGSYPTEIDEFFARYRNFYMQEIEAGRQEPLRIDKKLMFSAFTSDTSEKGIMDAFWKALDRLDFAFNKTEDAVKRIYNRLNDRGESKRYVKNYCINLLTSIYLYPEAGDFAEPKENAEKLDEEYETKLNELSEALEIL